MKRSGRPRKKVDAPDALITQRVRSLVDEAHGGNVHEASKVTGVPSATLRALYNGRSANPGLNTLRTLGAPYGFEPGWFSDESPIKHHPRLGIQIKFRERGPDGSYHVMREVAIPWATWPLPSVFWRLRSHVIAMPPGDRVLIKKLDPENPTDAIEVDAAITKFLLAPLLNEEEEFGMDLLPQYSHTAKDPKMIQRMRLLGLFWEEALVPVLEGMEDH